MEPTKPLHLQTPQPLPPLPTKPLHLQMPQPLPLLPSPLPPLLSRGSRGPSLPGFHSLSASQTVLRSPSPQLYGCVGDLAPQPRLDIKRDSSTLSTLFDACLVMDTSDAPAMEPSAAAAPDRDHRAAATKEQPTKEQRLQSPSLLPTPLPHPLPLSLPDSYSHSAASTPFRNLSQMPHGFLGHYPLGPGSAITRNSSAAVSIADSPNVSIADTFSGLPHSNDSYTSLADSFSVASSVSPFDSAFRDHSPTPIRCFRSTTKTRIAVLGYGLYGRALVSRLRTTYRYDVAIGSRTPQENIGSVGHRDAVRGASIVFMAIPKAGYESCMATISSELGQGTVLVDIMNHSLSGGRYTGKTRSNAEQLQKLAPEGVSVVKAFNNISSYDLAGGKNGPGLSKRMPMIHMASDDADAISKLGEVVVSMRMVPVNFGGLAAARELEAIPHRLFPTWRMPIIIAAVVFCWWLLYCVACTYVLYTPDGRPLRRWENFSLSTFTASTGQTSMTLFALTFLAGPVALCVQVIRGSIAKPFGRCFGAWMGMRKELGMVAFVFAAAHCLAGTIHASKESAGWKGAAMPITGIASFMAFAALASSSNASVSEAMSWAEFRSIFSYVGAFALSAGVLHQGMWGAIMTVRIPRSAWVGGGAVLPSYWLGIILPLLTLVLRVWSWSPFMSRPLKRLRGETAAKKKTDDYVKPSKKWFSSDLPN